jgi:hypothetical protein
MKGMSELSKTKMINEQDIICPLCKRNTPNEAQEKHHLTPKQKKGKETVIVCKTCGDQVHQLFTNKELAKEYNTIEALLSHPAMQKYVEWIQKKPHDFTVCMKMKKRKNK